MRALDLKKRIIACIEDRKPLLITGAPGMGKTDIVSQAAAFCKADLVPEHPVTCDPTDFKGMPAITHGKNASGAAIAEADFLPFGNLRRLIKAKKRTVYFIDDFGQAAPSVQAASMHLLLARHIGEHKISDEVVIIAATNRAEDRAAVSGILEPVKSRFMSILNLDFHEDDWIKWAMANHISPELIAFVKWKPGLLHDPPPATGKIVNRPSPRTVSHLDWLIKRGFTDNETMAGCVGEGYANEFAGFLRVSKNLPTVDEILASPAKAKVPTEPAACYSICASLAARADVKNGAKILQYITRLEPEFSVLGVLMATSKCNAIEGTKEYIDWAVHHRDVLM